MLHLNRWDQFSCISATAAFGSELKRAPPAKQRARSGRLADATVTKLRVRERSFWSGWKMMENVQEMPIIFRYDSDLSIILLRVSVRRGFLHMDAYKEKTGVQLYKPTFLGGSFFCQKKKLSVGNPVSSSTNCVDCVGGETWKCPSNECGNFYVQQLHPFKCPIMLLYIYCECGSKLISHGFDAEDGCGVVECPAMGSYRFHILVTWWLRDVIFKNPAHQNHQNGLYQKKLIFFQDHWLGSPPILRDPSWSLLVGIILSSFQTLHWNLPTIHVPRVSIMFL